jgi:FkbM family methyltransferase
MFKSISKEVIRFSVEEPLEGVVVRVKGLYSPAEEATPIYDATFKSMSNEYVHFVRHSDFLSYPYLKLILEKDKKSISEILIQGDKVWSLSNYFSVSELKEINKVEGDYNPIFLHEEYGRADQIPELNTIVDLGFNCGWFALFSSDKAQKYIAVEADDRIASMGPIINKKNKHKIKLINKVFHDTNDQDIIFHLAPLNHSGTNCISQPKGSSWTPDYEESVKKKTINLPEIINSHDIDYIDLLKVDIEGAESFLLKEPNLEVILNKVGIILMELHGEDNHNAFSGDIIQKHFNKDVLKKRNEGGWASTIRLTKKPELSILQCINTKQN